MVGKTQPFALALFAHAPGTDGLNRTSIEELEASMDTPLLCPITKRYADRSTAKAFAFSFFCDQCGKEWRSTPQTFDPSELKSPTDLRIFRMLWNGQHKAAYEQANLEAIYALHYCPECGCRVCMECFCRSETDIADICKDCLSRKNANTS